MPSDDEALPSFAPQWLRSSPSLKASLGAGAGGSALSKSDGRSPAALRQGLSQGSDKDSAFASRRAADKGSANGWGSGSPATPAHGKPRAAAGALGSRSSSGGSSSKAFRASSLEGGHDRSSLGPYREDDEARFNFGGLGGRGAPGASSGRATSLDSPAGAPQPRRPWDEPALPRAGGRTPDRSPVAPVARHDNGNGGGMRLRMPEAVRGGPVRAGGGFDREYPSLGGAPRGGGAGRAQDSWQQQQPLSPPRSALPSPGRSDTEAQWTSRLAAAVSPGRAASVSALLSSPDSAAPAAAASAPATPRMADALLQGARGDTADAEGARRQLAAARQPRQLVPPVAPASPAAPQGGPAKPKGYSAAAAAALAPAPASLAGAQAGSGSTRVLLGHVAGNGSAARKAGVDSSGRQGSGGTLVELGGPTQQATVGGKSAVQQNGTPVKSPSVAPGAAREKDRNSFFESLRRKDSPVASLPDACEEAAPVPSGSALSAPQSPKAAAAAAASHAAGSSKPAEEQPQPLAHAPPWQPGTPHAPAPAEASGAARDAASHSSSNGGAWVPAMNGNGSSSSSADQAGPSAGRKAAKLVIPAEEEAFLRSLGWEACDDDEDEGGLTQEEIAAFHAKVQAAHLQQRFGKPVLLMNGAF